ncbi:bolA-like protein 2 [Dinothrombium tinctorium]|uniref:BolA-like protein 2 n=1 Tax=Dinothrombium tinctorium TaxID=1965070 RepID=A0A3S3PC05_9ACAR|nr:bolA-like protein 2 [Dinothrombium tinctorium]RWS12141.1 bolA-like protein 2 [Dinothrombium tinctorium]RWS12215.1 bolA-like protein 2 [Dinothrombium tinctorium]
MVFSSDHIKSKLQQHLDTSHLEVNDVSDGCGAKFDCVIVSDKFEGKTLLQRHRMVNDLLKEEMPSIHAFTMKTLTTEQFNKTKS